MTRCRPRLADLARADQMARDARRAADARVTEASRAPGAGRGRPRPSPGQAGGGAAGRGAVRCDEATAARAALREAEAAAAACPIWTRRARRSKQAEDGGRGRAHHDDDAAAPRMTRCAARARRGCGGRQEVDQGGFGLAAPAGNRRKAHGRTGRAPGRGRDRRWPRRAPRRTRSRRSGRNWPRRSTRPRRGAASAADALAEAEDCAARRPRTPSATPSGRPARRARRGPGPKRGPRPRGTRSTCRRAYPRGDRGDARRTAGHAEGGPRRGCPTPSSWRPRSNRLKRQREALGAVNLRAEEDAQGGAGGTRHADGRKDGPGRGDQEAARRASPG